MNTTQKHEERPHALASPSGYSRWSACSGALTLQKKLDEKGLLPEDTSSPAAERGTYLHEQAELALLGHDVDDDLPEDTLAYIDYCTCLMHEGDYHIEARVPLFYAPEDTGTVDFACIKGEVLIIVDYKSGRFPVKAENNMQALIYALGLVTVETKEIHMVIHQFGVADKWVVDIHKARALASDIAERAKLALDDSITELTPSDTACKWCQCRAYCTAHTDEFFDILTDANNSPLVRLTDETLVNVLAHKKKIQNFLDSVEKVLYDRSIAGEAIQGVTVKQGRKGNKRWKKDINPTEEMVKAGIHLDQAQTVKPITPTQASKLASISEDLYEQPEGKPTIIANSIADISNEFEDLT